jgi:hypothetical protein
MTSQDRQSQRPGGPGTYNTGSDAPSEGAERPAGTVDEDANPPLKDPDADDTVLNVADGTAPSRDAGAALPPYEGRQTSAKDIGLAEGSSAVGAARPEENSEYRSPKPQDTPGGATASPADEQPASQASETQGDDEGVEAPAQAAGTRRGEDKP